jgi:hypothetical protein
MSMDFSITQPGQFSGTLKSFLQQLRSKLGKQGAAAFDRECSARDWDALLSEAFEESAGGSPEARERSAAIVQIMQRADVSTRISIADSLLFASDLNEAHDAIIMHDQERRKAA